jgi:hypothetical protein
VACKAIGSTQVTYVMRHMGNFIEDFIDIANDTTHVVQNGTDFGTFTNIQFRNSNVPKRDYQGMVFQADYRPTPNWQIAGNYTLQLENDGTFAVRRRTSRAFRRRTATSRSTVSHRFTRGAIQTGICTTSSARSCARGRST